MHLSPEDIQKLFAERGLRCTRQRTALYASLASTTAHPTADELYRRVSNSLAGVSLATVYNTLEAFCDAGLAQKLPGTGANGSCRFDANALSHIHLRDEATGQVSDVADQLSDRVLRMIDRELRDALREKLGFEIEHIHLEVVGRTTKTEN